MQTKTNDINLLNDSQPKIYVACLAAYNAGYLHGIWICANQSEDEIQKEIQEMLASSPIPHAEEWAIHDFECFEGIRLEEYSAISEVVELAQFVTEHGELGGALYNYLGDVEDAKTYFENCYYGAHDSETDFARDFMSECYEVPDYLSNYINYEAYARDLFCGDFLSFACGDKTHVFCQH